MNKKHTFFLLLSLFLINRAYGMDQGTITFISNQKYDYPQLVKDIFDDKELNNFASEQFVCSQDGCIKSMKSAQERGAQVHLTVGAHSENKQVLSKITNVRKDINIHGKITTGVDCSPSKTALTGIEQKKGTLLFGSGNTTNMTWKHKPNTSTISYNFEAGLLIKNNTNLTTQAYNMTKSQSPMKTKEQKTVIQLTPEKPTLYGSKDTNLNKSVALRLQNFAKIKDPNKKAFVRTMTFSDQEIADALIEIGTEAELMVDNSALTKNGIPLLDKISDAGVPVHVFRATKGSRAKQHAKDVYIETKENQLYTNLTANFSAESNAQRNYMICVPNNKQIMKDAQTDFTEVKQKCIPYADALQLKREDDTKKAEKRKLNAATTLSATKKQKK